MHSGGSSTIIIIQMNFSSIIFNWMIGIVNRLHVSSTLVSFKQSFFLLFLFFQWWKIDYVLTIKYNWLLFDWSLIFPFNVAHAWRMLTPRSLIVWEKTDTVPCKRGRALDVSLYWVIHLFSVELKVRSKLYTIKAYSADTSIFRWTWMYWKFPWSHHRDGYVQYITGYIKSERISGLKRILVYINFRMSLCTSQTSNGCIQVVSVTNQYAQTARFFSNWAVVEKGISTYKKMCFQVSILGYHDSKVSRWLADNFFCRILDTNIDPFQSLIEYIKQ